MVNDQKKAGRGVADGELLTHVANRANEALQMTLDAGSEYFPYLQQLGGHSVPRTYQTTVACGAGITQPLIKECRRLGVRLVNRAKFDSLIFDDPDLPPISKMTGIDLVRKIFMIPVNDIGGWSSHM